MEMEVYFTSITYGFQIPTNILEEVQATFSKFEMEYTEDGYVIVKVPKDEMELKEKLRNDILTLLKEVEKENSVLARKLAHRYRFKRLK